MEGLQSEVTMAARPLGERFTSLQGVWAALRSEANVYVLEDGWGSVEGEGERPGRSASYTLLCL